MKTNILMLSLLAIIVAPVIAQESTVTLAPIPSAAPASEEITIRQLADETGLSERRVRMVVGPRSGYAEYLVTFERSQRDFKNALGEERYNDLMAGRRIEPRNTKSATVASVDAKPAATATSTP